MVRNCLIWAVLLPLLPRATRLQDQQQILPKALSRQVPRLVRQTRPRLIHQARRHASNGNANAKAFEELIVHLGIFSKESARQLMEYASKGPNTRFYEAVQRAYRPTAKQVADILKTHGIGAEGRRLTNSIQRSFTGQGFVEQVTRRSQGPPADLLLNKIKARVPMIEAGIPVARIWETPIPQHLKKLVQEAVQEAFLAGKYGTGDAAQKIMAESAKEPSVEHAKDAAEALGMSAQEVLATTLQNLMRQSVEAGTFGTFTETNGSGDGFLWQLHNDVLALSDEDLAKATTEINAALLNARSLIETREGLQAMSEAEAEGELDVEDQSQLERERCLARK